MKVAARIRMELYREKIKLMEGAEEHLEGNSRRKMDELITEVERFKAEVEEILEKYEEGARREATDEVMEQVWKTSRWAQPCAGASTA